MTELVLQLPEALGGLLTPMRYKVYYGGRGSGKSWGFAIALLVMGMKRPISVLCARELQVSISDSVLKLLANIIASNPAMAEFYEVQTKKIRGRNGTEFSFLGLRHNAQEIKSYEGVDYVWVEEAQAVSDASWEILIPTIRKEGSEIWIGFNPKNPTDPTWQRFVVEKRTNAIVRKVGYQDNPFFPEVLEDERLHLLKTDPEAYRHIWEGEFDTRYSGSVYATYVKSEQLSDKVAHDPEYPVYTAWDLGFGDATAIVFYQVGLGEIFIIDYYECNLKDTKHLCEVLYGREITIKKREATTGEVLEWEFGADLPLHAHRKEYKYHPDKAHHVPHDAGNKIQAAGGRSIIEQANRFGIRMHKYAAAAHINNEEALRQALPRCWINNTRCKDLIHALMSYHYTWNEDKKKYSDLPQHDWSSHGCDAAELMARVYREKAVTVKAIENKMHERAFFRARKQLKMDSQDPYRIKPVRRKR